MPADRHFATYSSARTHLRAVLDFADAGRVTTVRRENSRFAVIDADRLLEHLVRLRPSQAVVVAEGGGWAALLQGVPVHGDGTTFDEAVDDLIDALREYAEDWNDRLLNAPNHQGNWPVVEIVELATDAQLKAWLLAHAPAPVVAADAAGLCPA